MSFTDRNLTCQDCGATFVFTADDQQYHSDKGFANEPKRCPSCRSARRSGGGGGGSYGGGGGGYGGGQREMHDVVCSQCGKDTQVPFRPSGDRPVYCSDCFSKRPQSSGGGGGGRGGSRY